MGSGGPVSPHPPARAVSIGTRRRGTSHIVKRGFVLVLDMHCRTRAGKASSAPRARAQGPKSTRSCSLAAICVGKPARNEGGRASVVAAEARGCARRSGRGRGGSDARNSPRYSENSLRIAFAPARTAVGARESQSTFKQLKFVTTRRTRRAGSSERKSGRRTLLDLAHLALDDLARVLALFGPAERLVGRRLELGRERVEDRQVAHERLEDLGDVALRDAVRVLLERRADEVRKGCAQDGRAGQYYVVDHGAELWV